MTYPARKKKAMNKKTYADGLKDAWDLFNKHGMSIISQDKENMFVTVSHGKSLDNLTSSITFSRKSGTGILSFLYDEEWKQLKDGKLNKSK